MAGGFFAGVGKAVADAATEQENQAFELKLQSAKLEHEHQNRISEALSQQSIEKEKYERESKISPGVSAAASKALGVDLGDLHTNDASIVDALAKAKQMSGLKEVGIEPQYDEVGLHKENLRKNGLGYPMGAPSPEIGYQKNRETYDKLLTYNTLLTQSTQLYNDLKIHNALGTGSILNRLPENLIGERQTLLDNVKKLGPLSAGAIEGVPGGRYVQSLSDALTSGQPLPQKDEQVFRDETNTTKLMIYSKIRNLSSHAVMPEDLTQKFGGLLHDQGGNPVNPSDVSIVNDKIYYAGSGTPVGDIHSPFLAIHPHAAQSFAKHVAGQATQQAGQSKFGSAADADAWLKANP